MDEDLVVCIYSVENYSAMKREEVLPFVMTQMDLEGIMLNAMS